jgi:hypothetical protein
MSNESVKMIERARSRTKRVLQSLGQDNHDDSLILNAKHKPGDWITYGKHQYQVYQLFTKSSELYYMLRTVDDRYFQETESILLRSN